MDFHLSGTKLGRCAKLTSRQRLSTQYLTSEWRFGPPCRERPVEMLYIWNYLWNLRACSRNVTIFRSSPFLSNKLRWPSLNVGQIHSLPVNLTSRSWRSWWVCVPGPASVPLLLRTTRLQSDWESSEPGFQSDGSRYFANSGLEDGQKDVHDWPANALGWHIEKADYDGKGWNLQKGSYFQTKFGNRDMSRWKGSLEVQWIWKVFRLFNLLAQCNGCGTQGHHTGNI